MSAGWEDEGGGACAVGEGAGEVCEFPAGGVGEFGVEEEEGVGEVAAEEDACEEGVGAADGEGVGEYVVEVVGERAGAADVEDVV